MRPWWMFVKNLVDKSRRIVDLMQVVGSRWESEEEGGFRGNRKQGNRHTWSPDLSFFLESTRALARVRWVEVIPVHLLAHLCNWGFSSSNRGVAESNGVRMLLLVVVTSAASTPILSLVEVSFIAFVLMAEDRNKSLLFLC